MGQYCNNILFLKGISRYDALRRYIDEIAFAFRKQGFHTLVIDTRQRQWKYQLEKAVSEYSFDVVFTCNGSYLKTESIRKIGQKFVTFMFDHPVNHDSRLKQADQNCIIIHCDRNQSEYINRYYQNVGKSVFIPLSGSFCIEQIPYHERKYEIVFTGSYKKPEVVYEQICQSYTGSILLLVKDFIKKLLEYPDLTYENALKETFKDYGLEDVKQDEFHELAVEFQQVGEYVRLYFRDKIIRQIITNGIKIHIFGEGWEEFESEYANNLIVESGNWYIAQKAVANAKISLNVMPWFKAGFQERIATAMLSGAVALTDSSKYIDENFTDMENIALYDLKELDNLPVLIKYILNHEEIGVKISQNGKKMALENHRWENRSKQIIGVIKEELDDLTELPEEGCELDALLKETRSQTVALDVLDELSEIGSLLHDIQVCQTASMEDYHYCVNRLLKAANMFLTDFPNADAGSYVWKLITAQRQEVPDYMPELISMQIAYIERVILHMENQHLHTENDRLVQELDQHKALLINERKEQNDILIERFYRKYGNDMSADIQELLSYIRLEGNIQAYNYPFVKEYLQKDLEIFADVFYDQETEMHYVMHQNKRMYYPKGYDENRVKIAYRFISIEQDDRSPHRYLDKEFEVQKGDIVIDGGVAEGNFSLEVVERVKKIYLIECDDSWIEALEKTFEPWKEKVVIINKMLGSKDAGKYITMDTLTAGEEVNFIKLDVEGAELDALKGAENTLKMNHKIQCAICCYHRKNDECNIKRVLEEKGFHTSTTKRYMYYRDDPDAVIDTELRRGIVRGIKMS